MRALIDPLALAFRLLAAVVALILAPVLVGIWIDQRAGTSPWAVLVFMLVGILLSTLVIYRLVSLQYRK